LCCLSQFVLQLQSVCSYIFTVKCSVYTAKNLNFIFHSNHSVSLLRHFYVLLAIGPLMLLWTALNIRIIKRYLQITIFHMLKFCFLYWKLPFIVHVKAWRTWRYCSSTQCYYYIQWWMEVSGEFDAPAALPPEQEPPSLLDSLLGGPQGQSGQFGKGRLV
jgi:hypothetical protein